MNQQLFKKCLSGKFLLCFLISLALQENVPAQNLSQFFMIPGSKPRTELATGQELHLFLNYVDTSGSVYDAVPLKTPFRWLVNGRETNSLKASDGSIQLLKGNKAIYTAPFLAPLKNPVDISVVVQDPLTQKSREIHCKVAIKESVYKITMDAEQTLPIAGQDIKLHGECTAVLKAAPDGAYFLEPLDKTRNMQVKVENGVLAEKDGGSQKLTGPLSYTFPFLFEIGKMDKAHPTGNGTMNLYYTSPQSGKVVWKIEGNGHTVIETLDIDNGSMTYDPPGTSTQMGTAGNVAQNAIAMSTATQLNLVASYNRMNIGNTTDNISRNISNSQDMMALAKRMQAHENDPNYFKTKQGKADLQKLMSLRKKVGGNIANTSEQTKKINKEIDDNYANNPNYAGSKKMYSDVGKLKASELGHKLTHNENTTAQVAPGNALLRIEGKFNPKSSQAFYQEIKGATPGGDEQQIVFKIKVIKIQ